MIKALLMWLAGATFEVRLIKLRTGKDIPGRLEYRGGYWQARKKYKNKPPKTGQMIRLQAVSQLYTQTKPIPDTADMIMFDEISKLPDAVWEDPEGSPDWPEASPVVSDEHDCNNIGPLDWDQSIDGYAKTCSICGSLQSPLLENV